jgi:hypothetical protein
VEDLPDLRVRLHPSVTLLESRCPVVSIWEANRNDNDNVIGRWAPECALVARPHLQVEVRPVSPGACAFMSALAQGRSVGSAIAHGMANTPGFDLGECFDALIAARVAVELLPEQSPDLSI